MELKRRHAHSLRNVVAGALVALATLSIGALHAQSVTNTATVSVPGGVFDPVPANNTDTASFDVSGVATYDFCPAGANPVFSLVNGVNIWRYDAGTAADVPVPELQAPVAGELNGLMVDRVRNRLLFVQRVGTTRSVIWAYDAANGGWYQAVPEFVSPDFPRAAIGPDGVGYLVAGGSNTPAVWRISADPAPGSFGYTVVNLGNLSYDVAPTNAGSGDLAFDGAGTAWLSAGRDLYTIDFTGPLLAERQVRPLLNGSPSTINWAGVAFGADGTLYVANNAANGAYYAYDPGTGELTSAAPTSAGASRDLASCAFPLPAEPELSVVKTLAERNGAPYVAGTPLQPGDVLGYDITLANSGGAVATLYPGDVMESLPEHTAFVAAGNDFTCTGANCPNTAPVNVAAGEQEVLRFVVEVDDPLPSSATAIANAVTVSDVDCAAAGNDCSETTPIGPVVAVSKSSDAGDGASVAVGQTLVYTIEVVVGNAATTVPVTVTDTLGAGLEFVAVTSAGAFDCSGALTCVLPAGTAPGTWPVSYTATVSADAVASVANSVTTDTGTCTDCSTSNPVLPAITVVKAATPATGTVVVPGATIGYTLTVTVASASLGEPLTLVDTLGAGLTFGAVTDAGAFDCSGALVCVLPAGTTPGTYTVGYSATVDADASGTVGNTVVASNPPGGDPDPVCTTCATEHDVTPASVTVVKSADPASGSTVLPGATIAYTLTVTVADSATTEALTLVDTLGTGLAFGAVTDAGPFQCSGALECVLPAGQLPGTYAVAYTAVVDADATGTVGNSVVASNPPGGDPDPVCTTCATEHDVTPASVTVVKSADPASGSTVLPGATIAYTLTVTVADSATTEALTLVDTLGAGLTFGAVTDAGLFQCSASLECVLPAGQLPGSYAVTYTAIVDADATGTVGNSVVASNPPGGDPDPVCTTCATEHEISPPSVTVAKSADPASGSAVLPGSTIAYTLTVTVADSATTEAVTLVDTLGAGLAFGAVTDAGLFQCTGALQCVLPAGQLPGTYTVTYTATVDADATGTVANSVVASNPPGGDPDPVCTTCATEHDVAPSMVSVVKTADPASGSTVLPGSTIAYTLTVTVGDSATTEPLTLVDTLGDGLTFGSVTDAGLFQCSGTLECVLPAGRLPGGYAVTYTATVDADATGTVGNSVVASNPPGGDPDPVCTTCATEHEVTPSTVSVVKTAAPATGSTVLPGSTIAYTLTVTVADSATTEALTLVDTLGEGLSFGSVTDAGLFQCSGALQCVLPAGQLPGTYAVTYTATVDADATGSVGNSVVAGNPPGGDPDPVCTTCSTEHEITPPSVTVLKTSDPASGSTVSPGSSIQYTLSVSVANSATTEALTLVDTLGEGLTFGSVTDAGPFQCSASLECVLPAGQLPGTYQVTYVATVDADATGSVGNSVVASNPPGGDPDPVCSTCATEHDITPPTVTVVKSADPASGSAVLPGATIAYTLNVTVGNSATTEALTLVDSLGDGLTFGGVTDAGAFQCSGALQCVLPAGQLPGTYAVTYSATVDADATGTVANSVVASNPPGGDPDPVCTTCTTGHEITPATVTVVKSANPPTGSTVLPGATIAYTLSVTVGNSATTEALTLVDTLGDGLTFDSVTDAGPFQCSGTLECVLPAGQLPGTYAVTYTATVDADATGTVANSVVASNPPGGDPDPVCTTCTTEHEITPTSVTVLKTADPAAGTTVLPGATIAYTLVVTVANSATTEALTLVDTLGEGLAFGSVTDAGLFQCSGALECVLPAGQLPGTYSVTYTAMVDTDATGSVGNSVVATNPPGGDPDPVCTTCTTEHPIEAVVINVAKSSDPANGAEVRAGDVITYTLAVDVLNSVTTEAVTLVDTLGPGLSFVEVVDAGAFDCTGTLTCMLPAGALPGRYAVVYTAVVDAGASGSLGNVVVATGGGGDAPDCASCSTTHELATPRVTIAKASNPGSGAEVAVGDTIEYTLEVLVEDAATQHAVTLVDQPGVGLELGAMPDGCAFADGTITCTLPAGTVPGRYAFAYPATVTADAVGSVANVVAGTSDGGPAPECTVCETTHEIVDEAALRITKVVGSRTASIGDLVRYTLTVENVGTLNVQDGTVIDTPPAGFSYVDDSMAVADGDGAFTLAATRHPLRIGGLDIAVGERATVTYLLRVGAGVRPGTHVNTAVAVDGEGDAVSNVATAQLVVESDPLLDDSLVFGTVFDDRDGDGWQDSARLEGLRVQGGFAASAYVPGSTTVDHGTGPQAVDDASAPLLHGLDLGALAARESAGQPVDARRIVVRQLLREAAFTDDFVLTSRQGVRVTMDAGGATRLEREGEAAKGQNAAEPVVERRVAHVEGGIAVEYLIDNAGIDERGIAGVRIATVEGLLVETDQYGRYHLADIAGGDWARGRNLVLKVDPATLPPGTVFTTDNPLLRRVTPGLPVRFDFGAQLPVQEVQGGQRALALELGEVIFAPGSAELRAQYLAVVERMAAQVDAHGGGEVAITAGAGDEALAFARAQAVADALTARVSEAAAAALRISLETEIDGAAFAGIEGGETFLGHVLFDTDRAEIRPEFTPLLDAVARRLEAQGGGAVAIVGHADVRGPHAYNAALGLRRAQAVYEALAARLGPGARAGLRVESSAAPAAPVGGLQ